MENILIVSLLLIIFGFVVAYLAQRKITELEGIISYHREQLQTELQIGIEDVSDEVKALGHYLVRLDPDVIRFPDDE